MIINLYLDDERRIVLLKIRNVSNKKKISISKIVFSMLKNWFSEENKKKERRQKGKNKKIIIGRFYESPNIKERRKK
ncbi:MAG: hypothetical protein NC833_03325 [Candidatus Omnitrophica bacterium]|nr:hypothetical protein [Candidatus Omnitrophota bacterium]